MNVPLVMFSWSLATFFLIVCKIVNKKMKDWFLNLKSEADESSECFTPGKCTESFFVGGEYTSDKVAFSSTSYAPLFCTTVFFLYLQFGFMTFCRKNIGKKAAGKMSKKLTTGVNFINVLWASIFCTHRFQKRKKIQIHYSLDEPIYHELHGPPVLTTSICN